MKFLLIVLSFAFVISAILAADLNIRKIKGGGFSRSRGGSSSSSSRRSGTSSGSSSSNSRTNSANSGSSLSNAQQSQSQGVQSYHQIDNIPKNAGSGGGEKISPKIDGSSGAMKNQNQDNGGSMRDGIGQIHNDPMHTSGLSSGAVVSGMMLHNHGTNGNFQRKKSHKNTTTTEKPV